MNGATPELPSAVIGPTGRTQQKFLEMNVLPGGPADEVTPRRGPR